MAGRALMEAEFWLRRWREGSTPWHEGVPNAALARHVDDLGLAPRDRVFVPLCGKAEDMWWLHERGLEVLGIDLSPIAARDFLRAHRVEYRESRSSRFSVLESPGFRLLAGDFFALEAEDLAGVAGVYDRAALVALPPDMRRRYARHLVSLVEAPILLVSMVYPEHEIEGPPFSVPEEEVRPLFETRRRVRHLAEEDIIERSSLRQRGLTALHEHTWLIE